MGRETRIEMHREYMGATGLTFSHGADGCGFSVVRPQCNSADQMEMLHLDSLVHQRPGTSPEASGRGRAQRNSALGADTLDWHFASTVGIIRCGLLSPLHRLAWDLRLRHAWSAKRFG